MPLPDEKPRPSVANLIGRFEKQKTATSTPPPVFLRTSSVISHRTGDSAQEELKEKREWPPKSATTAPTSLSPPTPESGSALSTSQPSLSPPADKTEVSSVPETIPEPPIEVPSPVEFIPSDPPPSMPPAAKPVPSIQSKTATPRPSSIARPLASRPAARPSVATPSKPVSSASSATPSRQQLAGQSSATRTPVVPKPSPVTATPTRVRTPLSRSKTPLSTSRPKTPSSGLYAPTAASLARSRSNPPPPPPSDKPKRRPTTDLSKPTAASASKIRTPVVTPARGGKAPVTTTARTPAKPGAVKPATSAKPGATRSKVLPVNKDAVLGIAAKVEAVEKLEAVPAPVETQANDEIGVSTHENYEVQEVDEHQDIKLDHEIEEHPIDEPVEDHREDELDSHTEEVIESYDDDFPDSVPNDAAAAAEPTGSGDVLTDATHVAQHHEDTIITIEGSQYDNDTSISSSFPESHPASEDNVPSVEHHHTVGNSNAHPVGTELEDIVNLLEFVPKVERPTLEPSSVSDAEEIPDEY